jgi:cytochrome c biogenesis protein ResB
MVVPPVQPRRLRVALEDRGFRVQEMVEGDVTYLRADRYELSALATLLTHLAVLLLVAGYALTGWLGWQEVVAVPPAQAVPVEHRTGLVIRNDGFVIEHYLDGSAADYVAQVALLQEKNIVSKGQVRINAPLRYRGVGVHLAGFSGQAEGMALVLQVAWDPGARVVLLGGLLLLAGVMASVYLPHRRVYARMGQEQGLLTMRSSGRWDDTKAELVDLAQEVGE